jgi:hypothetical protein
MAVEGKCVCGGCSLGNDLLDSVIVADMSGLLAPALMRVGVWGLRLRETMAVSGVAPGGRSESASARPGPLGSYRSAGTWGRAFAILFSLPLLGLLVDVRLPGALSRHRGGSGRVGVVVGLVVTRPGSADAACHD